VGVTADAELADIWLSRWTTPNDVLRGINESSPSGLEIKRTWPVPLEEESLQAHMERAEYEVIAVWPSKLEALEESVTQFLDVSTFPWKQRRGAEEHSYDLRPMVVSLEILDHTDSQVTLGMVLTCGNRGSGRPEQITLALGFPEPPLSIHRHRLFLTVESSLLP
jgi:radical SAM-linked protein